MRFDYDCVVYDAELIECQTLDKQPKTRDEQHFLVPTLLIFWPNKNYSRQWRTEGGQGAMAADCTPPLWLTENYF
jgi:hypothetical protein